MVHGPLDAPDAGALPPRRRASGRVAGVLGGEGLVPEYPWESSTVVVNGRQVKPYALVDAAWLAEHPEYTAAMQEALQKERRAN